MNKVKYLAVILIFALLLVYFSGCVKLYYKYGSHLTYDENGFCWDYDGLRVDFFEKIGENEYNIKQTQKSTEWASLPLAFYVTGVSGKTLTFHILDVSEMYWTTPPHSNILFSPIYSGDGKTWDRVDTFSYDGTDYHFSITPEHDTIQISKYWPMNYEESQKIMTDFENNQYVKVKRAGMSKEDREIGMIELTNFEIQDNQKKHVVAICVQHSNEPMGAWIIKYAIRHIIETQDLLDSIHWYLIPCMNPDAVFHAHARLTPDGVDLNRAWNKNQGDSGYAIEVDSVRSTLLDIHGEVGIDMFFDFHSLAGNGYPAHVYRTGDCDFCTSFNSATTRNWVCHSPSSGGSSIAQGWANSQGITYSYTMEPSQIDWTITDEIINEEGVNWANSIYNVLI